MVGKKPPRVVRPRDDQASMLAAAYYYRPLPHSVVQVHLVVEDVLGPGLDYGTVERGGGGISAGG